jgi:GxxExxY protein
MLYQEITDKILHSFYKVYNTLGYGFLEKVYENSLELDLKSQGLSCSKQVSIPVYYNDVVVGNYFADLMVDNKVVVEIKAAENICSEHEMQLLNYLKATNFEVGLLLNFGKKPEFKRKIFSNTNK